MIMDYEKLHKDTITKLQEMVNSGKITAETARGICADFVPESDGERIRKALVELVHDTTGDSLWVDYNVHKEDAIAWLEKQAEQKPADKVEPKFKTGDWISGYYTNYKVLSVNNDGYVVEDVDGNKINILFENEKFHQLWTIRDAKDGDVLSFNDGHGNDCIELIKSITGNKIEFWFCLTNGNRYEVFDGIIPYTNLVSREDATPATKGQRDTLMKVMTDAGYEWDAEKKELKKSDTYCKENCKGFQETGRCFCDGECKDKKEHIKNLSDNNFSRIEQKLWSEEDNKISRFIGNAITIDDASTYLESEGIQVIDAHIWLEELKERVQQPKRGWSEEDERIRIETIKLLETANHPNVLHRNGKPLDFTENINWLKSLRPQSQWKPSERQKEALLWCVVHLGGADKQTLGELLEELNKL